MKSLMTLSGALLLTACAGGLSDTSQTSRRCFPVEQDDLAPGNDAYQGRQIVCSLDRIQVGRRDKYVERYPFLAEQMSEGER
ncbi:MAG TPA: hypothetical protein VFO41_05540 [Alphaproteobacteria bacterium]|nr:hypothetical protein [Alphaproteobacteria bacterium]